MSQISDDDLRAARAAHTRRHGHPSARVIDAKFGVDGDDGLHFENARGDRRTLLWSAYRGDAAAPAPGTEEAPPRHIADLDTAAIYAKFNAHAPGRKAESDV